MKSLGALLSIVLLAGCSDAIDERFATVQEARDAHVFEREWLPRIVPPSVRDIQIRGDPELEILVGEFHVPDQEFEGLVSRLQPYSSEPIGTDVHLASFLHAKQNEGLSSGVYHEGTIMWVLVCDRSRGRCSYDKREER
jgi:hypothetical protein